MQEFADALKEFSPDHDGIKEAKENIEELERVKQELTSKRKEHELKAKKEHEGK